MEERDARLFQQDATSNDTPAWNIVELESHRQLRLLIAELILLANGSTLTTSEMRQRLLLGVVMFGKRFATQLVRSLQRDDQHERQSVVWLLTVLNDEATHQPLQQMMQNERLPRKIRLSASLALAGMGVAPSTATETQRDHRRVRLYAIS